MKYGGDEVENKNDQSDKAGSETTEDLMLTRYDVKDCVAWG